MHDAVRADVLQALLNPVGAQYDSAAADLADHTARVRQILAGVAEQHVSPEVDAAVAAVTPLVDQYLTTADAIMTTIARSPAQAGAAYPGPSNRSCATSALLPSGSFVIHTR